MNSRARLALAVGAFVTAAASTALASPTYPGAIQDALEMDCAPPCTICHQDLSGGFGTVVEEFGLNMQRNGLSASQPETVADVLAKVEAANIDSDGDGTGDVAELRAGSDPNGDVLLCDAEQGGPRYGCGARIAASGDTRDAGWALGAALAVAAGLMARRRR